MPRNPHIKTLQSTILLLSLSTVLMIGPVTISNAGGCMSVTLDYELVGDFCNGTYCIRFFGNATGLHGDEIFHVDYGDGNTLDTVLGISGTGAVPIDFNTCYSYAEPGDYFVLLTVTPAHVTCAIGLEIPFRIFGTSSELTCNGDMGTTTIQTPNNSPPYSFQWPDGNTTGSRSDLTADTYLVTITDGSGCTIVDTVRITQPDPIIATISEDCDNGTAIVDASGGTPFIPNPNPFFEDFTQVINDSTGMGSPPKWTTRGWAGSDWTGFFAPIGGSFQGSYLNSDTAVYWWKSECIDIFGCANTTVSFDIAQKGISNYAADSLILYYNVDGSGFTRIWKVKGDTAFPTDDQWYNQVFNLPEGDCVEIMLVFYGSYGTWKFDNIRVDCEPQTTADYFYQWCTGETSANASGIPNPGTCQVTVTDGEGCESIQTIVCGASCSLTASHSSSDPLCAGECTGTATVTATTLDAPLTYIWSNGETTAGTSGLCSGTHMVTISDAQLCVETLVITISEPPPLNIVSLIRNNLCAGDNMGDIDVSVSGGVPGYTFLWTNGATTEDIGGLSAGTFSVTATDANGCNITRTDIITEPTPLTITTSPDLLLCPANDPTSSISVTAGGGTPGYTYQWDDATSGSSASITVNNVNNTTTTYHVTVTDASGCVIQDELTITTTCDPIVLLQDTGFCIGGTATINAQTFGGTGPYSFAWDPPFPVNGAGPHQVSPTTSTTYCVTITDQLGDTATACMQVTVGQPPVLQTTSTNASCNACNGSVSVIASGNGPFTYSWSNGCTTAQCADLCAGPSTVTVTDVNGCSALAGDTVDPASEPTVCFTDSLTGCVPLTHTFINCSTSPADCLWDFGDGTTSTDCNPTHIFLQPGCFDISLTISTPDGCSKSLKKPCYIQGYPWPDADFAADPVEVDILNPTINFYDKSANAGAWSWTFGDGDSSQVMNPIHTYSDTGCYPVTLYVDNQWGCRDTARTTVCVRDISTIYIPNAFTPNGDAKNEWFTVGQYNFCEFQLMIFDRWGNLIHETTSLQGWDGTANNGTEIVQEDVYVWKVDARDCYGKYWNRIGHVTVLR